MYCDRCGTTIHARMQFCERCGKRIVGAVGAPAGQPTAPVTQSGSDPGRVERNIQLLGGLWMVYGALRLISLAWLVIFGRLILPSIFEAMSSQGVSWSVHKWGGWWGWFGPFGIWFGGLSIVAFGAAYLVLGWALHARKPWARTFGLILGFLVLLRIPFGTALGIFTIWVLLPESSRQEYDAMAGAGR